MAVEPRGAAVDRDGLADEHQRLGRLRGLLDLHQRGELIVGLELLLDLRELHELLGELVGVQRIERVLVLQLRGQQQQEGLEIVRDAAPRVARGAGRRAGRAGGRDTGGRDRRHGGVNGHVLSPQTRISTPPLAPSMRP